MKKLFILISKAGSQDFVAFERQILKTYKDHGREDEVFVRRTTDEKSAVAYAREFIKEDPQEKIVIACGGDGTLGEVAGVLHGSQAALGLIPMGTANDFSKNFDYKNFDIEDTFEPTIRPIDLIDVNGKICINVMSLGFDTLVLETTYDYLKKKPELKERAFLRAVIKCLFTLHPEDLKIDLVLANGERLVLEDLYLISALCNGGYYGSGFNPAPNNVLDDGILELTLAKKLSLFEFLPLISKYKKGTHLSHPKVSQYPVKEVTIRSKKTLTANIDGEIFKAKEIKAKIIEKGLNWAYFS